MFLSCFWLIIDYYCFCCHILRAVLWLVSIAAWQQSSVSWEAEVNICQLSRKELWDWDEEPGCRLLRGSERVVTPLKQHISGINCSESVWNDRRETVWQYVVEVLIESQKDTFAVLDSSQVNSPFCNEPGQHDYGIGVDMAGILGVWGGAHGERRRRSLWMENGCPSPADYWVWGTSWTPQRARSEPRPEMHFGVFWRPQNTRFCTYMLIIIIIGV